MEKKIPVVVIKELPETDKILTALKNDGINTAEITFRTACAAEAIAYACKNYPDMNVGAGTVINAEQCEAALAAGAKFIVSPGLSPAVAKICNEHGVPYYPGCVTPTEIMAALELGITTVKFFPANVYGGLKAMKALAGPFPQIKFIPTGGVDRSNLDEFFAFEKVYAVGGSFMVKEALEKYDVTVAQIDDTRGVLLGKLGVMRYHDDQLILGDLLEQLHDLHAGHGIKCTRGLVGKQNIGIVDKRSCNRYALHLTARHLRGTLMQLIAKSYLFQGFLCSASALRLGHARNSQRKLHVGEHTLVRNEVIALENKADRVVSVGIPIAILVHGGGFAVDEQVTRGVAVKTAYDVQRGSLTAARGTKDRHKLAVAEIQ